MSSIIFNYYRIIIDRAILPFLGIAEIKKHATNNYNNFSNTFACGIKYHYPL
jgi:hypothetical protein